MASHGFSLPFPDDQGLRALFRLCVCFGQVSMQVLGRFLKWAVFCHSVGVLHLFWS